MTDPHHGVTVGQPHAISRHSTLIRLLLRGQTHITTTTQLAGALCCGRGARQARACTALITAIPARGSFLRAPKPALLSRRSLPRYCPARPLLAGLTTAMPTAPSQHFDAEPLVMAGAESGADELYDDAGDAADISSLLQSSSPMAMRKAARHARGVTSQKRAASSGSPLRRVER